MDWLFGWVDRLFNQYKFVRRGSLIAGWYLVFYAVYHADKLSDNEFVAIVGLIGTCNLLYQWDKNHDRENQNASED